MIQSYRLVRMKINLNFLANFLVKAKINTYAGEGKESKAQRPGFKELEFSEGEWEYRDSYTGFFMAPGQEVVRFKGKPIWVMAYSGGMRKGYRADKRLAKQTFIFLKEALKRVKEEKPFRGPKKFRQGKYEYRNESEGNLTFFKGRERIFYQGKEIFRQNYIGGLVIHK